MNQELIFILMATLSGGLFALGGTGNFKFASKAWRRYALPICLAVLLVLLGIHTWRILVSMALLCAFLHLGYGDKTSWLVRILVFTSYGIPSILVGKGGFLHFNWWVAIIPLVLTVGFLASRFKPLQTTVFWKSWEFFAGTMIACSLYANI